MDYWNRDGYQLASDSWTDVHNRSDGHDTSHSSEESFSEQAVADRWREHYLVTYDRFLRKYCSDHELDYDEFVNYISNVYGENDVRTKNTHRNDVNHQIYFPWI